MDALEIESQGENSPDLNDQMKELNMIEENKAIWVKRWENNVNKAIWVKRWGKHRKIATRFGVNKNTIKKSSKENLKIKFRKIIEKCSNTENWINIPRKVEQAKTKIKSIVKGDIPN
ncbi:hypothetical protein TSUD_372170 [Trifolium subterraneum]|uniref:Uncharacterized protein n=1 Tax=Trifolium subterraneum TaxID=3900 RepID=A0A2Z6LVQ9_TRISU|nr:hypothetical protein TSUD_372170 [Trifolium subterraneum]